MKLLIVRHADPDYAADSLTPTGWEEAELLSRRLSRLDVKAFYISPLGRARDTASLTLEKMHRQGEICPWLREFEPLVCHSGMTRPGVAWDWLPDEWTAEPKYFDRLAWADTDIFRQAGIPEAARWVWSELDALLARHGYVREREYYRAESPNEDTLVFFSHFGAQCMLLAHLLNVSPMVLWHGFCTPPSAVTTVVTEERRPGVASFRVGSMGDISPLYAAGREPSFSARFCEVYTNWEQRHD